MRKGTSRTKEWVRRICILWLCVICVIYMTPGQSFYYAFATDDPAVSENASVPETEGENETQDAEEVSEDTDQSGEEAAGEKEPAEEEQATEAETEDDPAPEEAKTAAPAKNREASCNTDLIVERSIGDFVPKHVILVLFRAV